MKKLIVFLLAVGVVGAYTFAPAEAKKTKNTQKAVQNVETTDVSNVLNQEFQMPTDEEIHSVLNQFNFDEKQKEYLFKETKKKFEEMSELNLQNSTK